MRDTKYVEISEFWEFEKENCENLDEADKQYLKPFSRSYCCKLWNEYVSEKHRHLMLVENQSDWKIQNKTVQEYNWFEDWNNDQFDAFNVNIAPILNWQENDEVYFFWSRYSGLETEWRFVCKYWMSFLYEDEMNIVINPGSEQVLIIGVNGYVALGSRVS